MRRIKIAAVALGLGALAACSSSGARVAASLGDAGDDGGGGAASYGYPAGAPHVPWFREVMADLTGVTATQRPNLADNGPNGSGVAVGDVDGDGRPDLVAPTSQGPTYVYRNLGALRFADVTATSGVDGHGAASGASLCDVDGDGDLDLFLAIDSQQNGSTVLFYRNGGHGVFTDATAAAGIAAHGSTRTVLCTDLDGDGLLDLYVVAYGFIGVAGIPGRADSLYRNRGDGTFEDIAPRLGLDTQGFGWTATASDYDGDGDLDLYVANDTFVQDDGTRPLQRVDAGAGVALPSDELYRNDGAGPDGYVVLTNVTATAGLGEPRSAMGVIAADLTGDGVPDYYVSNFGRKALLGGSASGVFSDVTAAAGLEAIWRGAGPDGLCSGADARTPQCLLVSWGSAIEDFDLDGQPDLALLSGGLHGEPLPQAVWRGAAGRRFEPVQTDLPWMAGRALVPVDLDADGDLDVVTTTWSGPVRIFENVANAGDGGKGGHWLAVHLAAQSSAPGGLGAQVTVNGETKTVGAGGVAYSSGPAEARFGLGDAASASVDVRWPSGFVSHQNTAAADTTVVVTEPALVTVTPRVAPADGKTTVSVVLEPVRSDGAPLGPGATVSMSSTAGTWSAAVTDNGDGSYTRVLIAPAAPALAALGLSVNGAALGLIPRVTFR